MQFRITVEFSKYIFFLLHQCLHISLERYLLFGVHAVFSHEKKDIFTFSIDVKLINDIKYCSTQTYTKETYKEASSNLSEI